MSYKLEKICKGYLDLRVQSTIGQFQKYSHTLHQFHTSILLAYEVFNNKVFNVNKKKKIKNWISQLQVFLQ